MGGLSCDRNFYPRSPYGERRRTKTIPAEVSDFYPRSPYGERLNKLCELSRNNRFLSTLSLRRATRRPIFFEQAGEFLSTLSLRRATAFPGFLVGCINNFYPRSPYGERQVVVPAPTIMVPISIHALLTESDFDHGVALVPH